MASNVSLLIWWVMIRFLTMNVIHVWCKVIIIFRSYVSLLRASLNRNLWACLNDQNNCIIGQQILYDTIFKLSKTLSSSTLSERTNNNNCCNFEGNLSSIVVLVKNLCSKSASIYSSFEKMSKNVYKGRKKKNSEGPLCYQL